MCECKPVPHPHAESIKAWADGIAVQVKHEDGTWKDLVPPKEREFAPAFNKRIEYRIKPQQSDLERYGVEVGDVWTTHGSDTLLVAKRLSCSVITFHRGVVVDDVHLKTLLFRRGTVNKL